MSEHNPFAPEPHDTNTSDGSSNVFLDLNKPDELTGVPNLPSQESAAASAGFAPVANQPSKMNLQVMLAGIVFVIGVGAIYGMRSIGMKAGIKENAVAVDYTPETTTPDFIKRFDTVMTGLDESSVAVVLESTDTLPDKPFTMASAATPDQNTAPQTNPMDQSARLAAQRAAEQRLRVEALESEANLLQLQSILGGSRPVARVSGQPVREGMMINDTFTVKTISGQSVVIEAEGLVFRLTLGEPAQRLQ